MDDKDDDKDDKNDKDDDKDDDDNVIGTRDSINRRSVRTSIDNVNYFEFFIHTLNVK